MSALSSLKKIMFKIKQLRLHSRAQITLWSVITIVAVCSILFKLSIDMRSPVFDVSSQHGDNGSTSLLNRATNWYEMGPLNLGFGMFNEIRTIEDENVFTKKKIYVVYSPADILKIVKNCAAEYTVNILSVGPLTGDKNFKLYNFLSAVPHVAKEAGKFYIYKISKADLLAVNQSLFGNVDEKIVNGDFSSGVVGWIAGAKVTLATSSGGFADKALKIQLDATASSGAYQTVPVKQGRSYVLNFYQKNGNTNSTYCFGSTPGGQEVKACQDVSNVQWTKYSYTFTAFSDVVYVHFYTRFNESVGDYSFIDEVSLIESHSR